MNEGCVLLFCFWLNDLRFQYFNKVILMVLSDYCYKNTEAAI